MEELMYEKSYLHRGDYEYQILYKRQQHKTIYVGN